MIGHPQLARMRLGRTLLFTGGAVVALGLGTALGDVHGHLRQKLFAWIGAAAFLAFAVLAVRSVTGEVSRVIAPRAGTSAASALSVLVTFVGYVVAVFVGLDILAVQVQHLLIGGALTGVVLGIALQQVLGNVFAGLVLLFVRPFSVGDHIFIRSGSLNGPLDGVVTGIGLTYVTVETDGLPLNIPNSAMLASAVGPWRGDAAQQAETATPRPSAPATSGDAPAPGPG
jgi:small-conductance mechanosensitive channel